MMQKYVILAKNPKYKALQGSFIAENRKIFG